MVVTQFVEQQLGAARIVLQRMQELQPVIVAGHAVGGRRDPAQQVEYRAAPPRAARLGEIGAAVGRKGDHLGAGIAGVPHLVQRARQQVVEGDADEQVEGVDRRQVQQRLGRLDGQVLEQLLDAQVQVVLAPGLSALPAHHLVQPQARPKPGQVDAQPFGQPLREQGFERHAVGTFAHHQRAGVDHRDHAPLLHVGEQVAPEQLVEVVEQGRHSRPG